MNLIDPNTTGVPSRTAHSDLSQLLEDLYELIAPTWPLATAVACNPLQGLEKLSFEEATQKGQRLFDADCLPGLWQLRQALAAGQLQREDFDEALEEALAPLPESLFLGQQKVEIRPIARSLPLELEDGAPEPEASRLLARALPHLLDMRPWQQTLPSVNQRSISWLGAFLDEGQAAWPMPYRERGFFAAVKTLLMHDRWRPQQRVLLRDLSDDSLTAIPALMDQLSIHEEQRQNFLRDHLLALPGWASFIRWRSQQKDYHPQKKHPINLTDYLAVRLLLATLYPEAPSVDPSGAPRELRRLSGWVEAFVPSATQASAKEWAELLEILQSFYHQLRLKLLRRWERWFRRDLGQRLLSQVDAPPVDRRPEAQLAFCIDVRSEPFRRQVEASGDYETFGFAGFFGLPIAIEKVLGARVKSLPVLLQPAHQLREQAAPHCAHQLEDHRRGLQLIKELKQAYKSLKYNLATPFAAVEALGLPASLLTAGRSFLPRPLTRLRLLGRKLFRPEIDLTPDVQPEGEWGIPLDDQLRYASNALRMMGLTRHFAPLVVLCGHGSQTENNPYAAALDCGACGGSHGGPNAAAMARILNQPEIRRRLGEEGITVPDDTLFVGAQHNTTTDEVQLIDLPEVSGEKQEQIEKLKKDLQRAQRANLHLRAPKLGQKRANGLLRRSADWSEVRPEWGLAGNAGFVVAPRHLTQQLDLRGRCFLHSYDWRQDPDGSFLEVILTAPLVVAQWINSQYFFSTVDNMAFGSGNKITHNVVGKVGIMQGNASDLMHGLPLQSVQQSDERIYHQPLRLTAVVVAPRERVQALVDKHAILQQMFFNEWVSLQVYDPQQRLMLQLEPTGEWKRVEEDAVAVANEAV